MRFFRWKEYAHAPGTFAFSLPGGVSLNRSGGEESWLIHFVDYGCAGVQISEHDAAALMREIRRATDG